MAIFKAVNGGKGSVKGIINYVLEKTKTENENIIATGYNCVASNADLEMQVTKELWGKTDGRQYKHFIQSFDKRDDLSPCEAQKIGLEFATECFKNYEVLVVTHNEENIHNHFIVNSVSYVDGKKFRQSKRELEEYKQMSDELCEKYGLNVISKEDKKEGREEVRLYGEKVKTYNINEYKLLEKNKKESYKYMIYKKVISSSILATSAEDFIERMIEKGVDTVWREDRKHITFIDEEARKVRLSNLEKTFNDTLTRENLESKFAENLKRKERKNKVESIRAERKIIRERLLENNKTIKPYIDSAANILNFYDWYDKVPLERTIGVLEAFTNDPEGMVERNYKEYIGEKVQEVYSEYIPEVRHFSQESLEILNEMTQGFGRILTKRDFEELKENSLKKMKEFHRDLVSTGFDKDGEDTSIERYEEKCLDLAKSIDSCSRTTVKRGYSSDMDIEI